MTELATLAGGCFWCTEAIFQRLKGVAKVTSGYAGGEVANPSYKDVVSGTTGHAEAIQIEFDPKIISFEKILEVFFTMHDPTTVNQQGADIGSQYRSVIFYHSTKQKESIEKARKKFGGYYQKPIVTEIVPFTLFYPAEDCHKNYYAKNPNVLYCKVVIDPKIKKLLRDFKEDTSNS